MLWDINGVNLGTFTEDIIPARGVHYPKYFVVGVDPKQT
jgi:hypothetical protein